MRSAARRAAALAAIGVLAGCGFGPLSGGTPCAPVATRVGIGLDIEAPLASRVSEAEMKVCWAGDCRSPEIMLRSDTKAVPQDDCEQTGEAAPEAASCGAKAVPTGGKHGFGDLPELPGRPVQVTVVLQDTSGQVVLDDRIELTPKRATPGEHECGDDGLQAGVVVEDGRLRPRS